MSNVNFILAQFFGTTATILLCSAYLVKNKKLFFLLNLLGDMTYGFTFIFVNSWGAGIISLLSCIQCLIILYYTKKQKMIPKYISCIFIIGFIFFGMLNFNSYWDIIPILTYLWFTIASYLKSLDKIRFMYLVANLALTIYDIMVMAYSNALEDGIESFVIIFLMIISYIRLKNNVKRTDKNSATLKRVNQLNNRVIGVKTLDLQSAMLRMLNKNDHKNQTKLSNPYNKLIYSCTVINYG